MSERDEVRRGMTVRSSDGKRLGAVLTCGEHEFIIEKYASSAVDYVAHYDDVADVSGGEIILSRSRDELTRFDRGHDRPGPVPEAYGDEGGGGRS